MTPWTRGCGVRASPSSLAAKLALRTSLLLLACLVAAAACRPSLSRRAAPREVPSHRQNEIRLHLSREPELDPALAQAAGDFLVDEQLFLGLTDTSGGALQINPEVATRWSSSADGLQWTLELREDVFWTDKRGERLRPLVAEDVVYSLRRLLEPELGSPYAALILGLIRGAREAAAGTPEALEVRAPEPHRLEIQLTRPAPYLPALLALPGFKPVAREAVELAPDRWTSPDNLITSGPYRLREWRHNDHLTLETNPHFYGLTEVGTPSLRLIIQPDEGLAEGLYEAGRLDSVRVPDWDVRRLQADPEAFRELREITEPCLVAVVFRADLTPMDQPLVRRAFSAALDRQALARSAERSALPAASAVPHGLIQAAPPPLSEAWLQNPQRGRERSAEWLAEAGYGQEAELPAVRLWHPAQPWAEQAAARVSQQWQEHLGAEVSVQAVPEGEYGEAVALRRADEPGEPLPPQAFLWRQCELSSFPDPAAWFLPHLAGWGQDLSRAGSGAAERRLEEGWTSARLPPELYGELQSILVVEEVRLAPLYYHVRHVLTKPWLFRTFNPLWLDSVYRWSLDLQARAEALSAGEAAR